MLSVVLIGLSLSMDAFAVSVSSGVCIKNIKSFHIFRASFSFGVFQFIMPILGWFLGKTVSAYISGYDHWIAFALLSFVGGKMIKEGIETKDICPADQAAGDIRNLLILLTLSVTTSIDALAAGLSLSVLGHGLWLSAGIIGGITFLVCLTGFEFGRRLGLLFEKGAQIAGGFILIGLGLKTLIQHLFFG
ncbi:MAG: manganese efflux pump MntP family protein [Treponema sp.]|jgi:putative Mn2+ efflux pump MntP|nr:manganese efflux pump MntP family protein [Treponema sp.]